MQTEYAPIVDRQRFEFHGDMVRFYNRSFECQVTPNHEVLYLNKCDGRVKRMAASDYTQYNGGIYRSAKNSRPDIEVAVIGGNTVKFDDFCEFMGYWLSDGSVASKRTSQIAISQQPDQKPYKDIIAVIERMGYKPKIGTQAIYLFDKVFHHYLSQFGKCNEKFVPDEIKNASKRQIDIFLNAFVQCDGHIKKPKSFVGNRGSLCVPEHGGETYYTTSERLMADLCVCLLNAEYRPSVRKNKPTTAVKKDGSIVKGNYDCYVVSKCLSSSATYFKKESVRYDGFVYDVTIDNESHAIYIMENGKCYWGSNCRCSMIPILISPDERRKLAQARAEGKTYQPKGVITDVPDNFKTWVAKNQNRIANAKTLPFFLQDNGEMMKDGYVIGNFDQETATEISFDKEIAEYLGIKPKQTENEPLLFADPTGGVATQVYGIIKKGIEKINVAKANKEKTQILQGIISNKAFNKLKYHSTKENSVYGINMGSYDKALKEGEIPANLNMAKKFVKNKYDVYLLSNPSDEKSADLIIKRKEKLYYVEGKTSSGGSSFINRLKEGSSQSERVSVNLLGQKLSIRHMAGDIKDAFAAKPNLNDLYLFKGSRLIVIHRDEAMSKEFPNKFIKIWSAAK